MSFVLVSVMRIGHIYSLIATSICVWNYLSIGWVLQPNGSWMDMARAARTDFGHPLFVEVVFTAAWNIWRTRNGKIFRNERPTFSSWRRNFIHDVTLLLHRTKCKYKEAFRCWVSSLT